MADPVAFRAVSHYGVAGRGFAGQQGLSYHLTRAWTVAREVPILPAAIIGLFVMFALFAPLLAPYDPTQIALTQKLKPPLLFGGSTAHLLGTDTLGRDVLSRLIWGSRVSLSVTAAVVVVSSIAGLMLGLAAGYIGGRTDSF